MAGPAGASRREVVHIVLTYGLVSVLWILLSDKAVEWMFADPARRILVGMLKGWLFVAVTGGLLYGLVWRLLSRVERAHEEQLRALSLLAAVADSSNDAIYAKDRQGRYLLFNRAACHLVGKAVEDVLGRDDRAIFPADQAEALMILGARVMETGQLETHEKVLDTVDGPRIFLATKGPLRNPQGTIYGMFGISRDITARKRIEEDLQERDLMFSAVTGYSLSALSLKYPDGRYALANPNVQKIHRRREDEILGRTDFDLFPEENARIFRANDELVMQTRGCHSIEEVVPVDGQPRIYMSYIFPVLAKDGTLRYVCRISLDITDRKTAESALQARNEELERFNRAMVGRELDMIELKRQINVLSLELGREPPFQLIPLESGAARDAEAPVP